MGALKIFYDRDNHILTIVIVQGDSAFAKMIKTFV
jgi:hypothetical protein